mgnify:FL=1|jgi:hypothetical protein|uniref:Uncharacterized protein n=1 Tax=Siphoviridae sp. ctGa111 TaxID=2825413 RepID=A0A8S5VDQ3_9CAUD|nr:MAG TPA: hypothetical protein [Siphoviridae sp. ctGa111]
MNLSKKTIKHILRILNDKCEECPVLGLSTRNYIVKNKRPNKAHTVFFNERRGTFLELKTVNSDKKFKICFETTDVHSPEQLKDL